MAPTKVTKTQDTPKKGSSKSPLNETNLLFLWLSVHHNKGNAPDWKAVAEKMNIVPGTAHYRYNQLKAYFESIGVSEGGVDKEPSTEGPQEPKTPRTPKSPKTPRKKTPKKAKDDDEQGDEPKPTLKMEGVVIKKEKELEDKPELDLKMEGDAEA